MSADATTDTGAEEVPGAGIIRAQVVGTAVFVVTALAATAVKGLGVLPLIVDPLLFLAGIGAFFAGLVRAADRSRTEEFGILNLFFLEGGSAPPPVRRTLLGCLVAQIVVAIATAALRMNTSVAFGILAPVYGISLCGLWGARHGTFRPRTPKPAKKPKAADKGRNRPAPKGERR
jgi:hypothetical protein